MTEAGAILCKYSRLSTCQMFLFLEALLQLCFPGFHIIYIKEKESWIGISQRICLLIQIQNEPCSYKYPKNVKVDSCKPILSFEFAKQFSYFKAGFSILSKFKVSGKKTLNWD